MILKDQDFTPMPPPRDYVGGGLEFQDTQQRRGSEKKGIFNFSPESFTLIEIMVVVAIISIILVIGVPGLIRSRITANETGAIAACRAIMIGSNFYMNQNQGFPTALSDLVFPASNPSYIDSNLASATTPRTHKDGYYYDYLSDSHVGFELNAIPISDSTGKRYFYVNYKSVIHYCEGRRANEQDPTL